MLTSLNGLVLRRSSGGGRAPGAYARGGFTLAELLVGITLFIALSAVVIPSVVMQVKKSNVSALVSELDGLVIAVNSFYSDIARYPSEVNQLVYDPDDGIATNANNTTVDELGFWHSNSGTRNAFPAGRIKRWEGPYLNVGYVPIGGGMQTTLNGSVARDFVMICTGGKRYLAIAVNQIELADARALSLYKEKDDALGPLALFDDGPDTYSNFGPADGSEVDAGLVRWYDSSVGGDTDPLVGTLVYLVGAVGSPGCTVP